MIQSLSKLSCHGPYGRARVVEIDLCIDHVVESFTEPHMAARRAGIVPVIVMQASMAIVSGQSYDSSTCWCQSTIKSLSTPAALLLGTPTMHAVEGAASDAGNVVGREVAHPDAHETWVTVQQLQRGMCGDSRPHFFRGVATVSDPSQLGDLDQPGWLRSVSASVLRRQTKN